MVGMLGYEGPELAAPGHHWTGAHWRENLVEQPARAVRDLGYPVQLLGLRAEESRGRRMNRRVRGPIYGRPNGTTVACPLADWEGTDVLAYVTTRGLPLSRVYLQPGDPERERRRTAAVFLEVGAQQGDWRRLREEQPAFWQELTAEFPRMRDRA